MKLNTKIYLIDEEGNNSTPKDFSIIHVNKNLLGENKNVKSGEYTLVEIELREIFDGREETTFLIYQNDNCNFELMLSDLIYYINEKFISF